MSLEVRGHKREEERGRRTVVTRKEEREERVVEVRVGEERK